MAGIAVGVIIAILVLALVGFCTRKFILEKCNNGKRNRKRGKNGSAEGKCIFSFGNNYIDALKETAVI